MGTPEYPSSAHGLSHISMDDPFAVTCLLKMLIVALTSALILMPLAEISEAVLK